MFQCEGEHDTTTNYIILTPVHSVLALRPQSFLQKKTQKKQLVPISESLRYDQAEA